MNGWWLIVVGVALIGFSIYQSAPQKSTEYVEPSPVKYLLYGLSLLIWGVAVYLFYNVASVKGWTIITYLVGSIVAFYAGKAVWRRAEGYNKTELESFAHKGQLQVAHNTLEEVKQRTPYHEAEVAKRIEIEQIEVESDLVSAKANQEILEINREEQQLRKGLIAESRETGLTPDILYEVKKERALGQVRTEQKYEEAVAVIAAGDILDTKDVQIIKKLTNDLAEEARKRQAVIDGNDAPSVKELLIAQHTANIEHIRGQINERQRNGLVQAPHRQEALGAGEGTADVRGLAEPSSERPPEPLPPKRPRGRPRKNPAE